MKPQKLTVVGGKRKQVDFDSRSEEYKSYNKTRWNYDKKLTRFYNSSAWRSTSKLVLLRDDYVCQMCGGEATMVDHIIPIKQDWNRRLDLDNLQASCKACNDAKANRENYGKNQLEKKRTILPIMGVREYKCLEIPPLIFYRGTTLFGYNNAALFRAQFSLFELFNAENFNVKEV